VDRAEMML